MRVISILVAGLSLITSPMSFGQGNNDLYRGYRASYSSGETPGQVLSPRNRTLWFNLKDSAKDAAEVEVSLVFKAPAPAKTPVQPLTHPKTPIPNAPATPLQPTQPAPTGPTAQETLSADGKYLVYRLGQADALKGDRAAITVTQAELRKLLAKHSHEVAKLSVVVNGKEQFPKANGSPGIYVGGDYDYACKKPALIVDYNGTIDLQGNKCIQQDFNDLIKKHGVTVFVVSTSGVKVRSGLNHLGFSQRDQFVVLGNESGGGYGGGEKALRISKHLFGSGACLLGFAGDTPSTDGGAATTANIPFFAVNQRDRVEIRGYERVKEEVRVCVLKYPREFRLPDPEAKCPAKYTRTDRIEIECKHSGGLGPLAKKRAGKTFWIRALKGVDPNMLCQMESFAVHTGNSRKSSVCRTMLRPRYEPREKETCDEPYKETKEERWSRRPIKGASMPSLDISDYPTGSIYTNDWCQLSEALERRLGELRQGKKLK